MSGRSHDAVLMESLRTLPKHRLDDTTSTEILRTVQQLGTAPQRQTRRWHRNACVSGIAAASVAVLACAGIFYEVGKKQTSVGTQTTRTGVSRQEPMQTYRSLIGFQPMMPSYVPEGLKSMGTSVGITRSLHPGNSDGFNVAYNDGKPIQVPNRQMTIFEQPAAQYHQLNQRPNDWKIDMLGGLKVSYRIDGTMTTAWMERNGLVFGVGGQRLSLAEVEKVLLHLDIPATGSPDSIHRLTTDSMSAAMQTAQFPARVPTYIPVGFQIISPLTTGKREQLPGGRVSSSFSLMYSKGSANLGIGEYYVQNLPNDQPIEKSATPVTIKGHTVYVHTLVQHYPAGQTTYYIYQWVDSNTGVTYEVSGLNGLNQIVLNKDTLQKVVESLVP